MKTNLLHFGWIIAFMSMIPAIGFAQTETDKINERLEKIEQQLSRQQSTISSLQAEIEAVTKQNLALKKNLNLTPTIAKAKNENLEARVVEVTGDPTTKDVSVVLMVENVGPSDKTYQLMKPQVIDENGTGYNDYERVKGYLGDSEKNSVGSHGETNYHPGAPYKVKLVITNCNSEPQYIKFLNFVMRHFATDYDLKFENLPIKWVAED